MFYLANEAIEKTTWYPLTLGWLVVIAGIGMFFGSTYLLLTTNLGARLSFLVIGAVAAGFLVVLSALWSTTATPLNVFKGRQSEWKAVEIVQTEKSSNVEAVQTIREKGEKLSSTEFANVKAAADTILAVSAAGSEVEKPESVADDLPTSAVLVQSIYSIGGSNPNPLHFEFSHTPQYAAVEFCQLDEGKAATAFRNTCDTSEEAAANSKVLILEKDLGSLRQPPMFLFLGSSVMFIIFLLALHWRDNDLREAKQGSGDEDSPTPENAEEKDEEMVEA